MLKLDLLGIGFHAGIVFGLAKDFLFKIKFILGRCDVVINVNAILHRHWLQSGTQRPRTDLHKRFLT